MSERRIEYLPLDDLLARRDPRNPKAHAVGDLRASLRRFNFTEPVLLDERTGLLSAGHGRVEVLAQARDEGTEPPEGVLVTDAGWAVPVVMGWASRDDAEAAAYLVASNRIPELGGWAQRPLAELLAELGTGSAGLEGVGYDQQALNDLLAITGVAGEQATSFLNDLARGERRGMGSADPLPMSDSAELALIFPTKADRDEAAKFLRAEMGRSAAPTMALALLALARTPADA